MYEGHATVWDLSITTTTRTLYCLAYRTTKARYSRFTLRMSNSKASITDSASLTLGVTDLSHGGVIEICFVFPHRRRLSEVTVNYGFSKQVVFLPQQSPILALMGYLDPDVFGPMPSMQLWSVVSDASHWRSQSFVIGTTSNQLGMASAKGRSSNRNTV
jgi:hypothetical protein